MLELPGHAAAIAVAESSHTGIVSAADQITLRLHRLRVVRGTDPGWPDDDVVVRGVLSIGAPAGTRIVYCPDAVTLVLALWQAQSYGARGQMIRATLTPVDAAGQGGSVRLEAIWPNGSAVVGEADLGTWRQHVARLAGQVALVLEKAAEPELLALISPALAGAATSAHTS